MHPQFPNQPDNFNRRAYTDMAVKIYGAYAPNKVDIQEDSRNITIVLSEEDERSLKEYYRIRKEA